MAYPKATSHNALLILRGLAVLNIICFHIPHNINLISEGKINPFVIFDGDGFAVIWIFLILSGYLMGKKYFYKESLIIPSQLIKFYIGRIVKITPTYYFVLAMSFLIHIPESYQYIYNLKRLLIFNFASFDFPIFYTHLWYVSVIMQMYLIFPFIFEILKFIRKKFPKLIILSCISFPIIGLFFRFSRYIYINPLNNMDWVDKFHKSTFTNLDMFIFGILLNFLIEFNKRNHIFEFYLNRVFSILNIIKFFSIIFFIALYFFSGYLYYEFIYNYSQIRYFYSTLYPIIVMVITGLFIIAFENPRNVSLNNVNSVPLIKKISPLTIIAYLGSISYEIYLFHYLILNYLTKMVYLPLFQEPSNFLSFIKQFSIVMVLTLLIIYLYRFFLHFIFISYQKVKKYIYNSTENL
jgi:peptidoglycan/LPS O-acetylase OafA/YrhL